MQGNSEIRNQRKRYYKEDLQMPQIFKFDGMSILAKLVIIADLL